MLMFLLNNMNIFDRIKQLAETRGVSMYAVSRDTGISQATLSRLKNQKTLNISPSSLEMLANYFSVNREWLLTGEGDPYASGLIEDTFIKDEALYYRLHDIIDMYYGDENKGIDYLSEQTNISKNRLMQILEDKEWPLYSELQNFLKLSDLEFNKNWLLTGEGEMFKSSKPYKNEVTPVPEGEYMMVEYVDLRASAGKLGGADVEQLPETHKRLVPKEYAKGGFLVVRVDGDSMDDGTKRSLSDGDEVLVYLHEGGIMDALPIRKTLFVITTRNGNVLKQITEINTDEKYIVCHSFNTQFSDFKVDFDDIYQIFIVCKVTQKQISLI
jgi:transcriptional regulator with XRE-family HTH domain